MTSSPPPRRRRLWPRSLAGKAGVVALFFLFVLVGAYLIAGRYSAQRLADAWKLSDEFGFSNDFEKLLGDFVPPEKNMAVPLDDASTIAQKFQLNARNSFPNEDLQVVLESPKYIALFSGLLADQAYEKALNDADCRPDYFSPVVMTQPLFNINLGYLQTRREFIRAELAIAKLLESQGKREEAVLRMVRASRLNRRWQDREPFLIGALINIAVRSVAIAELNRLLRSGPRLPPATHDAVEKEMAEAEAIRDVLPKIGQMEKIAAVTGYGTFPGLDIVERIPPVADNDKAYMISYLHRFMQTAKLPYYEAKPILDGMENDLKKTVGDPIGRVLHIGTAMMLPAVINARTAFDRFLAQARCLRIVNAMARRGDWKAEPTTLGLAGECLLDPFDGKPLLIKQTPEGTIVYSVGPDQVDGGGVIDMTGGVKDVGLGPEVKKEKK
jgi:hypothetical protein